MDAYMVMSTTKNKTRTKYSKEVSEKWRSQFLMQNGFLHDSASNRIPF